MLVLSLAILGLVLAACGSSSSSSSSAHPHSIVQLGDSVASGEGTLYGYSYDSTSQRWTGGDIDAAWPGPYPLCHDSPYAYGNLVAASLHSAFSQFACTGSSFENGIVAPRTNSGLLPQTLRPAQFGNWSTKSDLNAAYDAARPDLVLVTLGADDVKFSDIVRACVESNLLHTTPLPCTTGDPGPTVQTDFLGPLPAVLHDLVVLAGWIEARGAADHKTPKAVFTNYFNPLPEGRTSCPDSDLLATAQVQYLSAQLNRLNQGILETINGLHKSNIEAVDLSSAFDGHRWCSKDPWDYGLSIISLSNPTSLLSAAPFHPTPQGQRKLAELVESSVQRMSASG